MIIKEKLEKTEETFNQLKEAFIEKEKAAEQLKTEMAEIEKQIIFTRGVYQAYSDLLNEEAGQEDAVLGEVDSVMNAEDK